MYKVYDTAYCKDICIRKSEFLTKTQVLFCENVAIKNIFKSFTRFNTAKVTTNCPINKK